MFGFLTVSLGPYHEKNIDFDFFVCYNVNNQGKKAFFRIENLLRGNFFGKI